MRVVEGNRERVQVFQGVVLRRSGGGRARDLHGSQDLLRRRCRAHVPACTRPRSRSSRSSSVAGSVGRSSTTCASSGARRPASRSGESTTRSSRRWRPPPPRPRRTPRWTPRKTRRPTSRTRRWTTSSRSARDDRKHDGGRGRGDGGRGRTGGPGGRRRRAARGRRRRTKRPPRPEHVADRSPETDDPADEPHDHDEEQVRRFWREVPILLVGAIAIAILLKTFLVQAFFIPSISMEPTLTRATGSWSAASARGSAASTGATSSCSPTRSPRPHPRAGPWGARCTGSARQSAWPQPQNDGLHQARRRPPGRRRRAARRRSVRQRRSRSRSRIWTPRPTRHPLGR